MQQINIHIREAKLSDLKILKDFEQGVVEYERAFSPTLIKGEISYYDIEGLIKNEESDLIVAVIDDVVVGSGYLLVKDSKPYKKPSKYAYLGFMYVLPEYRGKGINGKIIEVLMTKAKNRNLTEIQLDVYAENKSAISAYTRRGFKPDTLKMRLNTEG
ncbi:GNAT family N-acetyltransferase [Cellulophaga baltica]|uniref:GNAT family N-acetyltransferase n=1 Tax=Cellulophaga TaxID=104264 RepID=UPI001C06CB4E|nr:MULTISPECIES: GNAT family N-acetyltransferase [Cellulophaga]MBU2995884.1 GNAT family N-acetyltransferase [Cellulophaga baltica]MDO6767279.1 GNAT family N-acetyltransferase [Cellulophaga sp. 1_MG-2023]